MQSYRVETTVKEQGMLIIQGLPFPPGNHVEVVIRDMENAPAGESKYSLRGTAYEFLDPFGTVAEAEWGAVQ
jgi:hypothetical protein